MKILPTILITGGLGFIGSHSAIKLYEEGYKVILVDNLSRPAPNITQQQAQRYNKLFLEDHFPEIEIILGDIRNANLLSDIFRRHKPDGVLHAAGQTSAVGSIVNPENDFTNNVVGLFNTLELSRKSASVKSFCYLSTNKVYGENVDGILLTDAETAYTPENPAYLGMDESGRVDRSKHTPYGVSKLAGDLYVQEYARMYGLNSAVFRMSCIYGPRQFGFVEQGWISHFLINAVAEKPIDIFGSGKQVRDILFISDLTSLIHKYFNGALSLPPSGTSDIGKGNNIIFNVGGGAKNAVSVTEVLNLIKKIAPLSPQIRYDRPRQADQKYYVSNISKVCRAFGWAPEVSPEEGILASYHWIANHKGFFSS